MTGMGRGLQANNPAVVAAFHAVLLRQAILVAVLLVLALAAWSLRRLGQAVGAGTGAMPAGPEPAGRSVLRIGFGILWIFDGMLQAQPAMPLGMPSQVVIPAASGSPPWVQHLVAFGMTIWNRHPVAAAASAVWIQVGIGVLLLVAPRGPWSRLAGVASLGWGLIVWGFGEAFGAIFTPGLSWMFGAPGAVLIYCAAGALIALPERAWYGERLGRIMLAVLGAFFVGMAVLQAWPGRGFWQGQGPHHAIVGSLAAMVHSMAQISQPAGLGSLLTAFGTFDAQHGWAVNLVVVVALGLIGGALLSGRAPLVRVALAAAVVLCLADWVLVEDLGFFGGTGTDPNSMIPLLLLLSGGYLALVRSPQPAAGPVERPAVGAARAQLGWARGRRGAALLGAGAAVAALGVVLVGAVPMAFAALNRNPDPIITEAINGQPGTTNIPAPGFRLVDQRGRVVTLASLRGRAVALTFLDPVCTTDCPLIAQQLRQASLELGPADTGRTEFVAVVANPIYRALAFVQTFDRQERLDSMPNWLYLTGSLHALEQAWSGYGIVVQSAPAGAMVAHSDNAFIIDPAGRLRALMGSDPGGSSIDAGSLATLIADEMRNVLR